MIPDSPTRTLSRLLLPLLAILALTSAARAAEEPTQDENRWEPKIREFYQGHRNHVRDVLDPVLKVFGAGPKAIDDEADKYIEDSQSDLLAAMRYWDGDELLKDWKEHKASRMAEEIMSRGNV